MKSNQKVTEMNEQSGKKEKENEITVFLTEIKELTLNGIGWGWLRPSMPRAVNDRSEK